MRHWSLRTEGLLDCSLGTRARWEGGDVAEGQAKETQHFFQKRLRAGWGKEGLLQACSRVAMGWSLENPSYSQALEGTL